MEIWEPVVGYEGYYEISSLGRVKRVERVAKDSLGRIMPYKEKLLKVKLSQSTGYPCVNLSKNGKTKSFNIHALIADAFIPNPDNLPCINHIDENRSNSVLSNLERCTYSYNNSYGCANIKRKDTRRRNLEGKHKTIYKFSTDGELVETFHCGVEQLEEQLGYSIGGCLLGSTKTAHGFVYSYTPIFCYEEDKPKSHQKYVIKIDDEGNEVERYKSVSEAGEANGFDRHLFSRTTSIGGVTTIRGMQFIVEKKENEYIPVGHKGPRPDLKGKHLRKIMQYSKEGTFIAEYNSVREAAISLGNEAYAPDISKCCNKKLKTARGYIWRHKGETPPQPFENEVLRSISQYTLGGEFVCSYPSIADAIKALGKGIPTCIGNNLAGRSHSAYGYIWKYKNE